MSVVQQRVINRRGSRSTACFDHAKRHPVGQIHPMRVVLTLNPDGIHADISGELDFSTAPRLDRVLRLVEGFDHPVSVDLSGVAFTDSTGLSPLFGSALRRAATGSPVITVTALSHSVRRVLDLLSDLPEVQLLTRVGMAR